MSKTRQKNFRLPQAICELLEECARDQDQSETDVLIECLSTHAMFINGEKRSARQILFDHLVARAASFRIHRPRQLPPAASLKK